MAELPPKPAGLVIGQERDRGSYGAVYSGELDGKPVVIKRIHQILLQAPNNDKLLREFYHECRVLSAVRHANVVSFIGAYWDEDTKEPLLVMEAAKENLKEYLERNKGRINVDRQVAICSSMAEGLGFLHAREEPIVHRDLKPENVLVWEDGTVKIADFGQSKLLDHPQNYMKTTQPGTVAYMPPEALKKNPRYTSKVDVFSLGAVMLEVGTQSPPSVWLEGIGVVPEVERHKDDLALLPNTHPLKPLIVWCLQDNHESRPDVKSTHDQVKLLAGGLKEPHYLQVINKQDGELLMSMQRGESLKNRLEEATRELVASKGREEGLQRWLEEATEELRDTKEREEGLQRRLEKSTRKLRASKGREKGLQRRLEEATRELVVTKGQEEGLQRRLEKSTRELRASKGWEKGLQRRLKEAARELRETKGREEGLERRLEEATEELRYTKGQEEGLQRRLKEATEELRATKGWEEGLQSRLEEATQELRATKGWKEGLQRRLEEATEELRATKGWEEGLQRRLEEITEELNHRRVQHQEVMQRDASYLQLEDVNKQLKTEFTKPLETLITTCDELEDAEKQLEVTPCDHTDTGKELEEEYADYRNILLATPIEDDFGSDILDTHEEPLISIFNRPTAIMLETQTNENKLDLLACTAHTQQFDDIHSDSEEDTEELRATNWEEGLQRGLLAEEVTEELNHRRVQHQEVMQRDASSLQLEDVNKQLKTEFTKPLETLITTCDELEDAEKQLEVTPCDLSVTWKELEEVNRVKALGEEYKAGLRENDIIRSVAMVTAEGVVGPDTEWSFEGIKRIARDLPSICALLMTVLNF